MRNLRLLVWTSVAIGAATSVARADEPPVLVTVPGGNQLVLRRALAADRKVSFVVPIAPVGSADPAALTARLVAVVRDGGAQLRPHEAIAVKLEVLADGPALTISVDFAQAIAPGSHQLIIAIAPRAAPGSAAPSASSQLLTLTSTVPAAVLPPPQPLVIERTERWLDEEFGPNQLELREVSGLAPLNARVTQDGALVSGDHPIGGQVVFTGALAIDASGTAAGAITLTGDFPLGTSVGRLLVMAPELAAPVVIPVEVRNRRPALLVVALFVVGTAAGYAWRTLLRTRRDRITAELAAGSVKSRIAALLAVQPAEWDDDVEALRAKRDAIDIADPRTISEAETELASARDRRTARVQQLRALITAGIELTHTRSRLPLGLDLVDGASQYEMALHRLGERNFRDAVGCVQDGDAVVDHVLVSCRKWAGDLGRTLSAFQPKLTGCPAPARAVVNTTITKLGDALGGAEAASQAKDKGRAERIAAMHEAWWQACELAAALSEGLAQFQRSVPPAYKHAIALRSAAAIPRKPPDRPEETLGAAIEACDRIAAAATRIARTEYGESVPDAIKKSLTDGDYAVLFTPPARPADAGGGGEARGSPIARRDAVTLDEPELVQLQGERPAPAKAAVVAAFVEPADPAERPAALRAELARVMHLRWLIAAAVTSGAALALYGNTFVGTWAESFGVLAAGFFTDLTADSVIEGALGKLRPKSDSAPTREAAAG